ALELVQVVKLENGTINTDVDLTQFKYYDISQLLLSSLFGLDNVRTQEYLDYSTERKKLIHKGNLNAHEKDRLRFLDEVISMYDPREGGEIRRTKELLEQLANQISFHHD
ncbi:MAG: hypothetical protein IJS97_04195, partial [Prevotella sp.]|nr:hypothetical protein [Prevotella sp.]